VSRFADSREIRFLLFDLLGVERLAARERYAGQSRADYEQALETAFRIAAKQFAPHNRAADLAEPRLEGGRVVVLPAVKAALDAFCEAGFLAAHQDAVLGGLQLPWTVVQGCFGFFQAANIATAAYPFLTIAAGNLLARFGSREQRDRYLKPMMAGRFFGTMCLSEPQAGSGLADIRTTARPHADGSWRLAGTKQWISAGEHELAENIIHLVLARTEGAPAGVKGLSLFIVPRFRLGEAGEVGPSNDVSLVSLLHKMGYRGTVSSILAFGERGDCRAELVGERYQGLSYMFQMMNEARIGVGLGAAMLGHAGYCQAVDYARERKQGRAPDSKDPQSPAIPIIEHADVKRLLLAQKAYAEGGMALCLYAAHLVDDERSEEDATRREEASLLLDLLTPLCKAWPSIYGPRANDHAIQVLGGYGYTRDFPVEQYYRDNRLNPIHEGTNGIQALDLVGRKLWAAEGQGFRLLAVRLAETASRVSGDATLAPLGLALRQAFARIEAVTRTLGTALQAGQRRAALADASLYLEALGHVVVGWLWLEQAHTATRLLASGDVASGAFYHGKLQACRYFFAYEMPLITPWCETIARMEGICAETEPDWL
jgi:butyryl-CoA dehydrogenase